MRYRTNETIATLSVVALVGMFVAGNEPVIAPLRGTAVEPMLHSLHYENAIIFNLCVGFLGGVIVWLLNVLVPERQTRAILRDNLRKQYQYFREDVISLLLGAGGSYSAGLPAQLSRPNAFRDYYRGENQQRWYDVLNYLQANPERLSDIVAHMQTLSNEVEYLLHKISIDDEEVHAFLKRLSLHTHRLQHLSVYSYDEVKYLGGFIFEMLAAWSVISGYLEADPVACMIEKI
ncbi:hypothetical protein [Rhodoferax saidenbachensis]|uniref:Uncharacterized protein n=1 Tax=Rhodoferax saidenbachensis TaxID=1484693 RepID=A0ABU1ZQG9_9BURK|nr:hypothetical protein [Rhodoferax saidenbachensis]MDR7307785.1 hypothetical protein [Rhodoferax saidenbachensis]